MLNVAELLYEPINLTRAGITVRTVSPYLKMRRNELVLSCVQAVRLRALIDDDFMSKRLRSWLNSIVECRGRDEEPIAATIPLD